MANKLLEEASKLYSSVNVKDSIANKKFSLVDIINIILEEEKEEIDAHQKPKDTWQAIDLVEGNNQNLRLSTTTTKYECPDCGATFDTPAGHRKHYQAFHGKIEDTKIIEQAEI
jgi:predicted RNA-binding Zn-ribbon protein involved in translation (DUF1610 family)